MGPAPQHAVSRRGAGRDRGGRVPERAAILADGVVISAPLLSLAAQPSRAAAPVDGTLRDMEREAIRRALEATEGHRKKAAQRLGIGLRTLYDKLKEYDLG